MLIFTYRDVEYTLENSVVSGGEFSHVFTRMAKTALSPGMVSSPDYDLAIAEWLSNDWPIQIISNTPPIRTPEFVGDMSDFVDESFPIGDDFKHLRGQHSQLSHGRKYTGRGRNRTLISGRDRAAQRTLNPLETNLPPKLHARAEKIRERRDKAKDDLELSAERQAMLMKESNEMSARYRQGWSSEKERKELTDKIIASQGEAEAILKQYNKDVGSDKRALYNHHAKQAPEIRSRMLNPTSDPAVEAQINQKMRQLATVKTDAEGARLATEIHDLQFGTRDQGPQKFLKEPATSRLDFAAQKFGEDGSPLPISRKEQTAINTFRDKIQSVVPEHALPPQQVGIVFRPTTDRENYAKPNMMMTSSSNHATYIHEFGHHLENSSRNMQLKTKNFYNKRTKGEVEQKLSDVTGVKGYRFDEVTKMDKFIHPYMGKKYSGVNTELLSMGFEMMVANPKKLAREDPEMFDLIYALMKSG